MSISAVSTTAQQQTSPSSSVAQIKQDFQNIGNALQAGNLDDAKKAYAQLQKDAPTQNANSNNPINADIKSLGKALNSGDIKAAQEAYTKIQTNMAQGQQSSTGNTSNSKNGGNTKVVTSSSNGKVYNKMDANKDGVVTNLEKEQYYMKHPGTQPPDATTDNVASTNNKTGTVIDKLA